MHLCDAAFGVLRTYDGKQLNAVAMRGVPGPYANFAREPLRPGPETGLGRVLSGERLIHITDIRASEAYRLGDRLRVATVELGGARTLLVVPLLKDDALLGSLTVYRQQVRPFSDKQIALLQNFAAQAVIAMENARLLTETRETLEQQTATAEVLQVINSSPGDLAPVFDAMVERAVRLCEADEAAVRTFDGESLQLVAAYGEPQIFERLRQLGPSRLDRPGGLYDQIARGERITHIADVRETDTFRDNPVARSRLELRNVRTWLAVALRKEGALLGVINVHRHEVRPFTDTQIALLQNFAAQAVIAIENARLITETREALEQQTATAEVLQVINSSPGDLTPVFDTILDKAHTLCGATLGSLFLFDGELFRAAATHGYPEDLAQRLRQGVVLSAATQLLDDNVRWVHNPDLRLLDAPTARAVSGRGGVRTNLMLPLRKDGRLLGAISCNRQEVRPFSDKEIALLENFAAQAVIAMENARLLTETREALEQQTATAEVLQVINSYPGYLAPVFDTILEKAQALCRASDGTLRLFDGEVFRRVASHGYNGPQKDDIAVSEDPRLAALAAGERLIHILDLSQLDDPVARAVAAQGVRTNLLLPLRKDGALLGLLTCNRSEVRPFSDKQIALLQNFAAQAVIAMENARLLGELQTRTADLQESLEYQTATSDVLKVISRSAFDLQRVLETLAESAAILTQSDTAFIFRREGDVVRLAAQFAPTPAFGAVIGSLTIGADRGSTTGRALMTGEVVRITDVLREPDYDLQEARTDQIRSTMAAPLLREGVPIGVITLGRLRVEPYAERQIELVRTFADQAVIAIENARLITELQARTRDLQESLQYQTATSDVLKVISRSTFDLQPVLDTLVETAARLCSADLGTISNRESDGFRVAATHATSPDYEAFIRGHLLPLGRGSIAGRAAAEGRVVQISDVAVDPDFTVTEAVTIGQYRTAIGVPLMREGDVIGVIVLTRQRVEPFTERQIELVRTFADQAVIAIENTRLITETREALEQQTATAEILQVINSSPGNLRPVFEAILEKAHALGGASRGTLFLFDGEVFRAAASQGYPEGPPERMRRGITVSEDPRLAALLAGERLIHVPDLMRLEDPIARAVAERGGVRTNLLLPLRKDDALLGVLSCNRAEVRPFSDKQIALLESFAAQAVIAMDNARLLDEIRQRQAELRVTFDNMGDGVAMFDAELRLAAWNRNFQQILDLSDELLAERPNLAEYVRYLATHGEYGAVDAEAEVRRLTEIVGTQWSAERTRPDGRVIEVRHNPVPSGGFVLIYSDITERKRAEAEIHAARHAAERALGELKTAQASLIQAEKMASLGQLTAGIAHEIKNPLNFVNNFAGLSVELLAELKETAAPAIAGLAEDERADVDEIVGMLTGNLEKIAEHGRRADGIVKSMLEHSRGGSGERREVDLNGLVEEALNLAYHGARAQDQNFNISLERDFDRALAPIELAPQEMTRVFLNLFGNGFYAAAKRQRDSAAPDFRPVLKVATRDLGEAVEIRIRDNGAGIPPEIRDKLFQPFFTTKPTGEGTGLGLSISWDIVAHQHGGAIAVDSRVGDFTEFTIRLPRARPVMTAEAAA